MDEFQILFIFMFVALVVFAAWAWKKTPVTRIESPHPVGPGYWFECEVCGKGLVRRTPDNPYYTERKLCDECLNDPCVCCYHEGMACDVCPDHPSRIGEEGYAVMEVMFMIVNAGIFLYDLYLILTCF